MNQTWTPDLDAIIIAERAKNLTCAAIAAIVGRTRNAVTGRANRLMIDGKLADTRTRVVRHIKPPKPRPDISTTNSRAATGQAIARRILKAKEANDRPPHVPAATFTDRFQQGYLGQRGRVSITELTHETCRWPIDQRKGPARYCGDAVQTGSSYCRHHRERSLGRWT